MQNRSIKQGSVELLPFVLLDAKTRLGKADIAVETIKITASKAGGPMLPVAAPEISGRGMGLYYWTPTVADLDTPGAFVYFAVAPGCNEWRDIVSVTSVNVDAERPVTLAELTAALHRDLDSELGRLATLTGQVSAISDGQPVAP